MNMREIIDAVTSEDRLDELRGIKADTQVEFSNTKDVIEFMKSKGMTILGAGMYGAVFDHPSYNGRYVLKLFIDDHYADFIKYCQKNPGDQHLPKFFGKLIRLPYGGSMIRIEPLKKMPYSMFNSYELQDIRELVFAPDRLRPEDQTRLVNWADRLDQRPLLVTIFRLMQNRPRGSFMDLNPGNFMLRGDTLVVSDPYSGAPLPFEK